MILCSTHAAVDAVAKQQLLPINPREVVSKHSEVIPSTTMIMLEEENVSRADVPAKSPQD